MVVVRDIEVGDWVEVEKCAWRNNPAGLVGQVVKKSVSVVYLEGVQLAPYLDEDNEFIAYYEEIKKFEEPLADWEKELMTSEEALVALKEKLATPTLRSRILEAANKLADTLENVDEKHIEQGAVSVGLDPWESGKVTVTFTAKVAG